MHFNPISYYGFKGSKAFFTVKAGSFTLLRKFTTAVILADSLQNQIVKEFYINVAANQKLNLTCIPFSTTLINFYAFINGIEIVSMSKNLYYSLKGAPINPLYVGQSPMFSISNNMALEMVYRLNVGGNLISPTENTGLFRKWSPDIKYFKNSSLTIHNASFIPKCSKIANYITPDDVYQFAWTMGLDSNKNKMSNLTWELLVDSGFHYLVRLHFCEIDKLKYVVGQRRFIIYIDYLLSKLGADVILWTNERVTPFYKDYIEKSKRRELRTTTMFSPLIYDLI